MNDVASKFLLKAGEYETETRDWTKLPKNQQTWTGWKTKFREAYVAKRRAEDARDGKDQQFGGAVVDAARDQLCCKAAASPLHPHCQIRCLFCSRATSKKLVPPRLRP